MNNHRKTIVFGILIIMCLSLRVGCEEKQSQKVNASKPTQQQMKEKEAIYNTELKNIISCEKITITNDSPCQTLFVPKTQEATFSEVTSWLQKAKLYKSEIPKPKNPGTVIFNAYVGPSILNISTSNNHKITILPAFYIDIDKDNGYSPHYITNVLEFNYDGKKNYVESDKLYDWLRNDKWITEFKQM